MKRGIWGVMLAYHVPLHPPPKVTFQQKGKNATNSSTTACHGMCEKSLSTKKGFNCNLSVLIYCGRNVWTRFRQPV